MERKSVFQDEIHPSKAKQWRAFTSVNSTCSFSLWIGSPGVQQCFWRLIQNEGKQDNRLHPKSLETRDVWNHNVMM